MDYGGRRGKGRLGEFLSNRQAVKDILYLKHVGKRPGWFLWCFPLCIRRQSWDCLSSSGCFNAPLGRSWSGDRRCPVHRSLKSESNCWCSSLLAQYRRIEAVVSDKCVWTCIIHVIAAAFVSGHCSCSIPNWRGLVWIFVHRRWYDSNLREYMDLSEPCSPSCRCPPVSRIIYRSFPTFLDISLLFFVPWTI